MSLKEIFGKNVRHSRNERKLSQEQLAFLCGLHRTYIGAVERNEKNISINNIEKIAKALDISPEKLLKSQGE
jgi:transcriptional regulator with XRE-family HTH domain